MKNPLTIVHLGWGTSPHVTRLASDQAARGHRVHVVSETRHGPFPSLAGVTFHTYPHQVRFPLRVGAVRRVLQQVQADVLHSHYVNVGGFVGVGTGFHPHVMHAWGSDILRAPNLSRAQALKTSFALRTADWILSPAKELQSRINALAKAELLTNEVLPWGIDTRRFVWHEEAARQFRAMHHLGTAPVVFSPRALKPLYNQDVLLAAWPLVLEQMPGAKLILSRFNAELGYQASLEAQAKALGGSVLWLDSLEDTALPAAYAGSDVIVSIPSSDAPALTVMEAMACERQVIVSDLPALRELVSPQTGTLVNPRDARQVARAISDSLTRPDVEKQQRGAAARSLVVATASREKTLAHLDELYFRLQSRKGTSYLRSARHVLTGAPR